jgi:hypothetical protein
MEQDIKKWLGEGEQSIITAEIKKVATEVGGTGMQYVFNVLAWMKENIGEMSSAGEEWRKNFRNRTAGEILINGKASGCGDVAVLFCTLARTGGIPTIFSEHPYKEWLEKDLDGNWNNHVLAKVFVNNKWYWVDPTRGNVGVGGPKQVGGSVNYVLFAEGLDSWDIGIRDWDGYKKAYLVFREKWIKENPRK